MGKGILMIVAGAMLASGIVRLSAERTALETDRRQSSHEEQLLAREIAISAYRHAVSQVSQDFENWRQGYTGRAYQGGEQDVTATGPKEGPVDITAEGRYGNARYQMMGTLVRSSSGFLDALTVDAGTADVKDGGDEYLISGVDTKPPSLGGGPGGAPAVHAVRGILEPVRQEFSDELRHERVVGIGGNGDFVSGAPMTDLQAIVDAIKANVTHEYFGNQTFQGATQFGTPDNPAVVVVYGKVHLKDMVRGYGILYTEAENADQFMMKDNAIWEGLVVVESSKKVKLEADSRIYGALVIMGDDQGEESGGDRGLPGGHFDVDVFDYGKKVYHEHQYDDKYNVTNVNLMSAGCKSNGGLCLNDIIDMSQSYRVTFFNAHNSAGNYVLRAGAVDLAGSSNENLDVVIDAGQLTDFNVNFTSLCALRASSPGDSQSDGVNRNGAFAVRMFDMGGSLVYELTVYHHANESKVAEMCGGGDDGGEVTPPEMARGKVRFDIKNRAGVSYSLSALMRLENVFPEMKDVYRIVETNQRDESTDLNGKLHMTLDGKQ